MIFSSTTNQVTEYLEVDGPGRLFRNPRFRDINASGQIAGWTGTDSFSGALANFSPIDRYLGMSTILSQGLNDSGVVVGSWTDPAGFSHGFISSPIPESGTATLLLAGLVMLSAGAAHRQARQANPA